MPRTSAHLVFEQKLPWWPKPNADVTWKLVGTLATPRGDLGATIAGQRIYSFGGEQPESAAPMDTVEAFDILTDHSVALASLQMPQGVMGAGVIRTASGKVLVFGGHVIWTATKSCIGCLPPAGPWHAMADLPHAAGFASGALGPDGKVYAIGGLDDKNKYLKIVQRFDPAIGTWSQVQPLNSERFGGAAATAAGKIYVFGGIDKGYVLDSVEEYDPVTDAWTVLPHAMPTPRYNLAAVTGSNGRIYVIGGMHHCSATDHVEEFNPATKTWKQMTPMPTPRYGAAAVATDDGHIFVLGGWRKISGTSSATSVIERGTLPTYKK